MTSFVQASRIALTPLTPIHIGCGETFEPTNYVIDGNALFAFDPSLATLTDTQRNQLIRLANDANLLAIQNFFKSNADTFVAHANQAIRVANEISRDYNNKLGKHMQQVKNGNNVINRLFIDRTTCHPHSGIPFLPGSSLKGAIRTAILDRLNNGRMPNVPAKDAVRWENDLLKMDSNKFEQSAFRLLKVSDLIADDPIHQIVMARQYKKRVIPGKAQDSNTIPVRKQVIMPGQYRVFSGYINLQTLSGIKADSKEIPALTIKDIQAVASDSNRYYLYHLERDLTVLGALQNARIVSGQWLNSFIKLIDDLRTKLDVGEAFLVKLGQYGGAESKTYNGNVAAIKIMHGKNKAATYESTTTTMWLSDCGYGNVPFGWALIEIAPENDLDVLKVWCSQHQAPLLESEAPRKRLKELKEADQKRKAAITEEKAKQAAKRLAEEKAAQEKAAALAAMSEGDRTAAEIVGKLESVKAKDSGNTAVSEAKNRLKEAAGNLSGDERQKCIAAVKAVFKKKELLSKKNKEFFKELEG